MLQIFLIKNLVDKPGSFYEEACDEGNDYCTSSEFVNYWYNKQGNNLNNCF